MAIDEAEPTDGFQFVVNFFQPRVINLNLAAAFTADQVVVVLPGNFVHQMPAADVSGVR